MFEQFTEEMLRYLKTAGNYGMHYKSPPIYMGTDDPIFFNGFLYYSGSKGLYKIFIGKTYGYQNHDDNEIESSDTGWHKKHGNYYNTRQVLVK